MSLDRDFSGATIDTGFLFVPAVADNIPNAFQFTDVQNAQTATQYLATTAITGVDNGQILTVTNGELSNDQGVTWSNSVSMTEGSTLVRATLTSAVTNSTPVSVLVTVNGVEAKFTIRTETLRTAPDQFTFSNVLGAQLNTEYESVQPIIGIDSGAVVSAIGGQVSNDGGITWLLSVVMVVGQTLVRARLVSSTGYNLASGIEVFVNGISSIFQITTKVAPVIIERIEDDSPAGLYMDELEALNLLLRSIGTAPVNNVSEPQPDVAAARTALNRARQQAQHRGWWFNIDYGITMTPIDGFISVPTSISSVVANDRNYVKRGDRMYNRYTNSYLFDSGILIHRLVRVLAWDDMPDCMREHCAYLAASQFIEDEISDTAKSNSFRDSATSALIDVSRRDLEEGRYNMYSSARIVRARGGVRPYNLNLNTTNFTT